MSLVSYDISLEIDTGGPEPAQVGGDWGYTSNCGPMWREAGANLAEFHGKTARECAPTLSAAIQRMRAEPETFIAMNPQNGWGSYESLVPALDDLLDLFQRHPLATVRVSR